MPAFRNVAKAALGLFLLSIPFYRVIYFSDRAILFRDLSRDFLVQKTLWADSIRAGDGILLWNHFSFGGIPFYSMNVTSPLHPLNFLFLLFSRDDSPRALSLFVWLHYPLAFFGAWALLRQLKFKDNLALPLSISLATSGYLLGAHSLPHILASAAIVPWWLFFILGFLESSRRTFLVAAGAMMAWPIYAGDPQFSYVMVILSLFFLWRRELSSWKKSLSDTLFLGLSSFLASAAQLLPTAELTFRSSRLAMESSELTLFSFHPIRLAETVFPIFFGNRFGSEPFWAGELVNFPYKTPFVFSTYPGFLILSGVLLLPAVWKYLGADRKTILTLFGLFALGMVLSFGIYSPVPAYTWLSNILPAFGLFRYPERFLFWPLFSFWLASALILKKVDWENPKRLNLIVPITFLSITFLFWLSLYIDWIRLPSSASNAVLRTLVLVWAAFALLILRRRFAFPLLSLLLLVQAGELYWNHTRLVWDQNIHVTDIKRYSLAVMISNDLKRRKEELELGASQRLSSLALSPFEFNSGRMDHTSATTFSSFQNLLPNVPAFFGIENIVGYHSVVPMEIETFFKTVVRSGPHGPDYRFLHDLMSVHYTPERDKDQQLLIKTNPSAQPYVFVPERVYFAENRQDSLKKILEPDFRSNKDLVVTDTGKTEERTEELGSFRILKKANTDLHLQYTAPHAAPDRQMTLNEGFDKHWQAYVNGVSVPILRANAWAMSIRLPESKAGQTLDIRFKYKNPWIFWGAILSCSWILLFGSALKSRVFRELGGR